MSTVIVPQRPPLICAGCNHCKPNDETSSLKEFFQNIKDPDIILTNDRVVWDNLYTEIRSLFEVNKEWVDNLDLFSFLEFAFESDYLLKKGSTISVLGLNLLAHLVKDEQYFISIKSHKVFSILLLNHKQILKSIYLQTATFKLIKFIAYHMTGKMWIVSQNILEDIICPVLFSSNEFMQKGAAECFSNIWCSVEKYSDAVEWLVAYLRDLIKNNIKCSSPKEGYDMYSIIKALILIIQNNNKQSICNEKIFNLVDELDLDPYSPADISTDQVELCHVFSFLRVAEDYARVYAELEITQTTEKVDTKNDFLINFIINAVYRFGVHISIIIESIDLLALFKSLKAYKSPSFFPRYHNVVCTLIHFQVIPLTAILGKVNSEIDRNPQDYFTTDIERNLYRRRFRHFEVGLLEHPPNNLKLITELTLVYQKYIQEKFDEIGCMWATKLINKFSQNEEGMGTLLESVQMMLIELMHGVYLTLEKYVWPDVFIGSIFTCLKIIYRRTIGDVFVYEKALYESCLLAITGIIRRRLYSPKLICSGLSLIMLYFRINKEIQTTDEDLSFTLDLIAEIIAVSFVPADPMSQPSTSTAVFVERPKSELQKPKFLCHADSRVRLASLKLLKLPVTGHVELHALLEWLQKNSLLEQVLYMISDPDDECAAVAISILVRLICYDQIYGIFISKNIRGFCLALVAEGKSESLRRAGIDMVQLLFHGSHFQYYDFEEYILPAVRIGAKDECAEIRSMTTEFINVHMIKLFVYADELYEAKQPSLMYVPSPQLAVLIWITQYGYGRLLMKLYYDSEPSVQKATRFTLRLLIHEMRKHELFDLAESDFKLYGDVPVEKFINNFKSYLFGTCYATQDETMLKYQQIISPDLFRSVVETLECVKDLTNLLPSELDCIQKYKKKENDDPDPPMAANSEIEVVSVQEFFTFLRNHEKATCYLPSNQEAHLLTNIEAYLTQLKAPRNIITGDDPYSADCY